ncbi:MAG: arginyltransferase, partial [Planctomycetes bacterium]|nr:arginyltransferase [Planctomycetota bacterium]
MASAQVDRVEIARRMIERLDLRPGSAHRCPYLPSQQARDVAFQVRRLPPGLYHSLMDLNFRRSGLMVYRPACLACDQCRAIRVPTHRFRPDRIQRRCWSRNRDVAAGIAPPVPTAGKYDLYRRYLRARHNRQMDEAWEAFSDFLYRSPVDTLEVVYRRGGR